MARAAIVLLVAACGGHPAVAPADPGPPCVEVAAHVVALAEADNAATAGPALAAGIRGETERQCAATPWSAARRTCLTRAATQDATLACPAE